MDNERQVILDLVVVRSAAQKPLAGEMKQMLDFGRRSPIVRPRRHEDVRGQGQQIMPFGMLGQRDAADVGERGPICVESLVDRVVVDIGGAQAGCEPCVEIRLVRAVGDVPQQRSCGGVVAVAPALHQAIFQQGRGLGEATTHPLHTGFHDIGDADFVGQPHGGFQVLFAFE